MDLTVRDVMSPDPCVVSPTASVLEAAQIMRGNDIGDVIVLEDERLFGIVTDRDIVVRALAEGADPEATPVGSICSRDLTTIEAGATVGQAVRLMRERAIRRLPVVDQHGFVMGVLSIGDIAVERDRLSALGDISAAPPNT